MFCWNTNTAVVILTCSFIFLSLSTLLRPRIWISRKTDMLVSHPYSPKSGTSGQLFTGVTVRKFPHSRYRYNNFTKNEWKITVQKNSSFINYTKPKVCDKWVVVTTIFAPSEAVQRAAQLDGWCVVVVADKKSSLSYNVSSIVYLSVATQEQLADYYDFVQQLPWNHFGRKNVGYFYAILQKARYIFDLDDDNVLKHLHVSLPRSVMEITAVNCTVFNVYPTMNASERHSWPRGFPLENIKQVCNWSSKPKKVHEEELVIFQSLADNDPDVDAVYRMTLPLPFSFNTNTSFGIPQRLLVPYNAQASMHYKKSFWGLLLPITVHGRVSDIWRSYLTQRLLWEIDSRIAFVPPWVNQFRNPHNYIQDFQAETDLYLKSNALINFLIAWRGHSPTFLGFIEELWVELYERNFIDIEDVHLLQEWIEALLHIGYNFPSTTRST